MKKPTRTQLEKYDINQKLIQVLADLESRHILFSIEKKSKVAEEIAHSANIPLTTVYKKLRTLEELALIFVEKIDFSYSGKKIKFYKSRIKEAHINIRKIQPQLNLIPNKKKDR